jgi:hypothetical protein
VGPLHITPAAALDEQGHPLPLRQVGGQYGFTVSDAPLYMQIEG